MNQWNEIKIQEIIENQREYIISCLYKVSYKISMKLDMSKLNKILCVQMEKKANCENCSLATEGKNSCTRIRTAVYK